LPLPLERLQQPPEHEKHQHCNEERVSQIPNLHIHAMESSHDVHSESFGSHLHL
jgi:hypothetical protein